MRCGGLKAIGLALCSALIPAAAHAADVTLSASDMSQALIRPAYRLGTVRVPGQPVTSDGTALDLITAPQASLLFDWRQVDLQLSYNPSFTLRDSLGPDLDRQFLVLNAGFISLTYAPIGSRWRLTLSQTGSIGQRNFATLAPLAPADPNVRPDPSVSRVSILPSVQQQTVDIATTQSSAALAYRWSPRWGSTLTLAYGIFGGIKGSARILPRQTTESGNVSLDYQLTRTDTLSTTVGTSHTLITNGYEYWFAQFGETWNRSLGKNLSLAVTGGLVQIWTRCRPDGDCAASSPDSTGGYTTQVRPLVSGGLRGAIFLIKRRHYALSLLLGSGVSPVLNPLTGRLQTRAQGSSTLQLVMDRTTVAATLDALQTLPPGDDDAIRVVGAGLIAAHRPAKLIELSIGYRSVWQFSQSAAFDIPRQWTAFAGIMISAPPLRF